MSKIVNLKVKMQPPTTKILQLVTQAVEKLVKAQKLINDSELLTESERKSLNEMLTESVMEFVDFDYINKMEKTK